MIPDLLSKNSHNNKELCQCMTRMPSQTQSNNPAAGTLAPVQGQQNCSQALLPPTHTPPASSHTHTMRGGIWPGVGSSVRSAVRESLHSNLENIESIGGKGAGGTTLRALGARELAVLLAVPSHGSLWQHVEGGGGGIGLYHTLL